MTARLDPHATAPNLLKPMIALEKTLAESGLEHSLRELVKTRASQINGCAFCLELHTRDARAAGESEARLYLLNAWREAAHHYTPRERAALAWTEALTGIAARHPGEADYAALAEQFSPQDQVALTLLIGAINTWNRLAIGFAFEPALPKAA